MSVTGAMWRLGNAMVVSNVETPIEGGNSPKKSKVGVKNIHHWVSSTQIEKFFDTVLVYDGILWTWILPSVSSWVLWILYVVLPEEVPTYPLPSSNIPLFCDPPGARPPVPVMCPSAPLTSGAMSLSLSLLSAAACRR